MRTHVVLPKNTLTHCQAHSRVRPTEKALSCMVDCESLRLVCSYRYDICIFLQIQTQKILYSQAKGIYVYCIYAHTVTNCYKKKMYNIAMVGGS